MPEGLQPGFDSLDGFAIAFSYQGRAAQAIRRIKYSRVTTLAEPLSEILLDRYLKLHLGFQPLIVPVPIHWSRRFARGFNQSDLLAKHLPGIRSYSFLRIRATKPQVGLSPQQRLTNLRGAFRADASVKGQHVLLVDDVLTSGGTATECARALKAEGAASVLLLTVCSGRGSAEPDA